MSWFDIIKGKYISSKVLKRIKKAINSIEGVTIDKINHSNKTQHIKIYCTYEGEASPDGKPVKFIISTGARGAVVRKIEALMKQNVKRALERKNVFIGEW